LTSSKIKSENGKMIPNLTIKININCHHRKIEQNGFFKKLASGKPKVELVWDNFDIFQVSEQIARALKAGGFTQIIEFRIDNEYIFVTKSKSKGKSIKEAIKLFGGESEVRKRYKEFKFKSVNSDKNNFVQSTVLIKRQHQVGKPPVEIKIKGSLPLKKGKKIIAGLSKNIAVKSMLTKPEISL
jgi:hypothetical protein